MTYADAERFLFRELRNYRNTGSVADAPADPTTGEGEVAPPRQYPTKARLLTFLAETGHPHAAPGVRYVHVAGTNGKGTVSHCVAAMARAAGLRVGLYTSPHYVEFRERVRIDGAMISEGEVVEFVARHRDRMLALKLSFFEATAALAFHAFAARGVEVAVLEVGLGGTWDASNVITPLVSVVTNIDLEHTAELGPTRMHIAGEKAAVIKTGTPVVVGRRHPETDPVFEATAAGLHARLVYADEAIAPGTPLPPSELAGPFDDENLRVAIATWRLAGEALGLSTAAVERGYPGLTRLSEQGYRGRFQLLSRSPLVLVDAGHNAAAWSRCVPHALAVWAAWRAERGDPPSRPFVVCGFKADKPVEQFFEYLPAGARVHVSQASVLTDTPEALLPRAPAAFAKTGHATVAAGLEEVLAEAGPDDFVFVGGSSYVVGDAIAYFARR